MLLNQFQIVCDEAEDFIQNDNNLAIAYYRYSSAGQNEASIEQQREQAHKYAEAHGFKIVKEYQDKAISGTTDKRPGFQLMLTEVSKLKPAVLILWKTDRLARDKYALAMSKHTIRSAGCSIHYVAEAIPDAPEAIILESVIEGMAEFYSHNLSQNVKRGLHYIAENGLYARPLLGYKRGEDGKYTIDECTAPVVKHIFDEYANGRAMTQIIDELTQQGLRSQKGKKFTVNSLRAILHNRSYMGEYHYANVVIPDGMPAIVSKELFEQVQLRFERNKRQGSQRANGLLEDNSPRYWLTGKLYCGECGETMHGMSGTSKTGAIYYYYACKNHRRKLKCPKKNVKKDVIESFIIDVLKEFLQDSEKLASLAVDVAAYYKETHTDSGYLDSLIAEKKEVEKALSNLLKAIEMGIFSETTQGRLLELESQKKALCDSIDAEQAKLEISQDEHSIRHYFELYSNADFENTEVRDMILEYFVDKIYLYEDRLVITCWYSDERYEVPWDEITEATAINSAGEFDCCVSFPGKRKVNFDFPFF